jgi:EF-hand domain
LQADIDNSGTIDYGEFIAATLHLNKLDREEHLVAAFSYFDKDGSGYITIDELQEACREHNMPDAFLDDTIKEVDKNNVSLCIQVGNMTHTAIIQELSYMPENMNIVQCANIWSLYNILAL